MTKDIIECYGTFNTKSCPGELIFGDFNDQHISSNYYNLLNDDNNYGNNIPGTPVENYLLYNKGIEDTVVTNDADIQNKIIIDYDDILASDIALPPQTEFWGLKEWTIKLKEGKLKGWNKKMNKWTKK